MLGLDAGRFEDFPTIVTSVASSLGIMQSRHSTCWRRAHCAVAAERMLPDLAQVF